MSSVLSCWGRHVRPSLPTPPLHSTLPFVPPFSAGCTPLGSGPAGRAGGRCKVWSQVRCISDWSSYSESEVWMSSLHPPRRQRNNKSERNISLLVHYIIWHLIYREEGKIIPKMGTEHSTTFTDRGHLDCYDQHGKDEDQEDSQKHLDIFHQLGS